MLRLGRGVLRWVGWLLRCIRRCVDWEVWVCRISILTRYMVYIYIYIYIYGIHIHIYMVYTTGRQSNSQLLYVPTAPPPCVLLLPCCTACDMLPTMQGTRIYHGNSLKQPPASFWHKLVCAGGYALCLFVVCVCICCLLCLCVQLFVFVCVGVPLWSVEYPPPPPPTHTYTLSSPF